MNDKFCFASVGTLHQSRAGVHVCCFVRLRAFRGIHPPNQRRKGGGAPPFPRQQQPFADKTTTNNPHFQVLRTPRPLNSVDATSAHLSSGVGGWVTQNKNPCCLNHQKEMNRLVQTGATRVHHSAKHTTAHHMPHQAHVHLRRLPPTLVTPFIF